MLNNMPRKQQVQQRRQQRHLQRIMRCTNSTTSNSFHKAMMKQQRLNMHSNMQPSMHNHSSEQGEFTPAMLARMSESNA
jgi:hypothetical protein